MRALPIVPPQSPILSGFHCNLHLFSMDGSGARDLIRALVGWLVGDNCLKMQLCGLNMHCLERFVRSVVVIWPGLSRIRLEREDGGSRGER